MIEEGKKVVSHPISLILSYLLSSGAAGTAVMAMNELENQQIRQDTQQQILIEQQHKADQKLEEIDKRQREIRDILIEIKTRTESH